MTGMSTLSLTRYEADEQTIGNRRQDATRAPIREEAGIIYCQGMDQQASLRLRQSNFRGLCLTSLPRIHPCCSGGFGEGPSECDCQDERVEAVLYVFHALYKRG